MAARSDPDAVRAWAAAQANSAGMCVVANLAEAMESHPHPTVAIVASRPRDHMRDGLEALRFGLHALVEKPISVDAPSGQSLVDAAHEAGLVLAMGTEFAFLPALHRVANQVAGRGADRIKLRLSWEDTANEFRHGATKVRHEEVSLLQDLLPHAFSMFQVFAPGRWLHVADTRENANGSQGRIQLCDDFGSRYEFVCDIKAAVRRRVLEIESESVNASLDFSGSTPSILIDGRMQFLDSQLASMTSTLRLELGAFLAMATGAIDTTFIVDGVPPLLKLQHQLDEALARNRTRFANI
jgi:hypothetical protein